MILINMNFDGKHRLDHITYLIKVIGLTSYWILQFYFTTFSVSGAIIISNTYVGIKFYKGSWQEVQDEAKRQHKPIFLDMYTTWCAPCKLMDKQAFPNPKVGELFNEKFISYQLDAEKGEGIKLAKQYSVNAFPTSLYIRDDGDLIHRVVGYIDIKNMLEEANKAIAKIKEPNTLLFLDQQYNEGRRDVDFLANYLSKLTINNKPRGDVLEIYLKLIPLEQWSSKKNLEFIVHNLTNFNNEAYIFLLKQVPLLIKSEQKQMRDLGLVARMQQFYIINNTLEKSIELQSESLLQECINNELKVYSTMLNQKIKIDPEEFSNNQRLYFYRKTKQMEKYKPIALLESKRLLSFSIDSIKIKDAESYNRFLSQTATISDSIKQKKTFKDQVERMKKVESVRIAKKLNELARTYFENLTDSAELNQALAWSLKSLNYIKAGDYLETYALLLNKLGRKIEAVNSFKEAIALEKENGHNTKSLENGLAELTK